MIKRNNLEQMAKLAKIDLDEKEIESLLGDLSNILNYIDKMKELDLTGVSLSDHSTLEGNITREDIKVDYKDREGLIEDFSARDGAYLKVRPIL